MDDQAAGNYTYDEIGNLIDDNQEEIDNIEWTIYGKIRRITRNGGSEKPDLEFRYDAMGNRICKIVKPKDGLGNSLNQLEWSYTYYARDASGNVMAVYERDLVDDDTYIHDDMTLTEQHLYGSSRVGLKRPKNDDGSNVIVGGFVFDPGTVNADSTIRIDAIDSYTAPSNQPSGMRWMTRKQYELSNHLGNVYAVVTDKKQGSATTQYTTSVSYYTADVIMATDYYAFGASMPARSFQSDEYRYGFNGVERETEYDDGVYSTDFRFVDTRIGRWMSTDPVLKEWESPYSAYSNNPIFLIDPSGADPTEPEGEPSVCGNVDAPVTSSPENSGPSVELIPDRYEYILTIYESYVVNQTTTIQNNPGVDFNNKTYEYIQPGSTVTYNAAFAGGPSDLTFTYLDQNGTLQSTVINARSDPANNPAQGNFILPAGTNTTSLTVNSVNGGDRTNVIQITITQQTTVVFHQREYLDNLTGNVVYGPINWHDPTTSQDKLDFSRDISSHPNPSDRLWMNYPIIQRGTINVVSTPNSLSNNAVSNAGQLLP